MSAITAISPITSGVIDPIKSIFNQGAESTSTLLQETEGESFSDKLANSIQAIKDMETQSSQDSYDLAMGNTDNLEQIMINSAKLNTTIQLATTITSRVVSTYKEILSMQI
jgi:flagellar hook-basal body complex protein FliE